MTAAGTSWWTDCYVQVAHVMGDEAFSASKPFPVEVVPAQLVARLLPD